MTHLEPGLKRSIGAAQTASDPDRSDLLLLLLSLRPHQRPHLHSSAVTAALGVPKIRKNLPISLSLFSPTRDSTDDLYNRGICLRSSVDFDSVHSYLIAHPSDHTPILPIPNSISSFKVMCRSIAPGHAHETGEPDPDAAPPQPDDTPYTTVL